MSDVDQQFALSNPISLICGKDKNDFTRDDLIKVILDKKIERITFHYTALDGNIKELKIPITNKKHAELILAEGERVDGSSLFKGMVIPGASDLYVVPVYKTAFLSPFDNKSLDFVCRYLNPKGELAPFTPDNVLNKAYNIFKKNTGMELFALGELEFYLIGNPENRLYPCVKQTGYHASAPFVKTHEMLNEMLSIISQITASVKYAHSEVGCLENLTSDFEEFNGKKAEQVEIEFSPSPIDEMADMLVLARWIIKNVAFKHNYIATFIPKLEIGHAGSGMHFHLQLKKDGVSVMTDGKGNLTDEAKKLIGGLCLYAPSLTAFGNMVSVSYLRLVPHQEAPTNVCWSELNRNALIRVPLAWSNLQNLAEIVNPDLKLKSYEHICRQTVEIRSPDGSAFIHLILAGITMATDWGFANPKESLEIAKNCHLVNNGKGSNPSGKFDELPTCCVESGDKLLENRSKYEKDNVFTPELINYIVDLLKNENDNNLNTRLMALPEIEKNKESRKIMHSNIYKY